MGRRCKLPPADLAATQTLARAVRFDVALFLGSGRYSTASALMPRWKWRASLSRTRASAGDDLWDHH
jgi:hypothetical protein